MGPYLIFDILDRSVIGEKTGCGVVLWESTCRDGGMKLSLPSVPTEATNLDICRMSNVRFGYLRTLSHTLVRYETVLH